MFIFYFLGVGPPCCSILCQFWLCEEAQCVYLRRHLGSPEWILLTYKEEILILTHWQLAQGFLSANTDPRQKDGRMSEAYLCCDA